MTILHGLCESPASFPPPPNIPNRHGQNLLAADDEDLSELVEDGGVLGVVE